MGIILWIILGGIVGWVASLIMHSRGGVVWDIVVGILGAVIGGWVMSLVGYGSISGFNIFSFGVALLGSVILLALVKAVQGSSATV